VSLFHRLTGAGIFSRKITALAKIAAITISHERVV
jgi:hypothetical protein